MKFGRNIDWWFVGGLAFLICIGLVMQYSIAVNQELTDLSSFYRQLTFVGIGMAVWIGASIVDYRALRLHPIFPAAIAVLVLVAVLIFGVNIKGTTGWFVIGPVSIQPVEFVKIFLILFMASYFSKQPDLIHKPQYVFFSAAVVGIISALILLQPDLGSTIMVASVWFSYMLVLRAPRWFIALVLGLSVGVFFLGWLFLFAPYQKDRLTAFINPEQDALGAGYNITQSIVAVGSGSFWGRGLGLGTQSQLHFLPEVSTDFIFAAIAEEFGFAGVMAIVAAVFLVLFRIWKYLLRAREPFGFLLLVGIFAYFGIQSFFVIGMNMGLLPVTGVPLPLVSAGGSSMIATMCMLGIAHRIGGHTGA